MATEKALRRRDWSSLPPEVLNLIAKYLSEIPDFVRFRVVCTAWRLSTPITDVPPQFPWILETWRQHNETNLRFYSLPSNKFYTNIPDPKSIDSWSYGISQLSKGYLLSKLHDHSQRATHLSLINPLNNNEISFPPCDIVPYSWFYHCPDSHRPELRHCSLGQVQGCRLNLDSNDRAFCRFYMKDMFITLNRDTGFTKVEYIIAHSIARVKPPVQDPFTVASSVLLEAWGRVVGVFKLFNKEHADFSWEVHYLDIKTSGSSCWVRVQNIGNHALFMDWDAVFMLKANDMAGIKANCIYMLYDTFAFATHSGAKRKRIVELERIDIQTGAKEHRWSLPSFNNEVHWFVPNLRNLGTQ